MDLYQLFNTSLSSKSVHKDTIIVQAYFEDNKTKLPENFYDNPQSHQNDYPHQTKDLVARIVALNKILKERFSYNPELLINQHLFADNGTFYLNWNAFLTTIEMLGTPSQIKHWKDLIMDLRITGGYAQTEVGHGSNVQGLETIAIFDEKDDTFIINSPQVTAYKMWPGMIGHFGTHMVLQAKTYSKDKKMGIQTFVVPIRDQNFQPLVNVDVGDQGTKLGFLRADNGYLGLKNYKVPRSYLLQRYIKVERDGTFIEASKDAIKFGYGSMLNLRVFLSNSFAYHGLASTSLAYEFSGNLSKLDTFKLIRSYVVNFSVIMANRVVSQIFDDYQLQLKNNDPQTSKTLNMVHLYSSAMKPVSAWESVRATREAVQISPYGNLSASDLIAQYGDNVPFVTYEGDNNVLLQQSGRYILKTMQDLSGDKPAKGVTEYFNKYTKNDQHTIQIKNGADLTLNVLLTAMERFAYETCKDTAISFAQQLGSEGSSFNKTWNELVQTQLNNMAKIFTYANIFKLAYEEITINLSQKLTPKASSQTKNIITIYGLVYILENIHNFRAFKILDVKEDIIYQLIDKLVGEPKTFFSELDYAVKKTKTKKFYGIDLGKIEFNTHVPTHLHSKL